MADTYEVTGVRERTTLGADARVTNVVTVSFKTRPHGATGTVDIDRDAFTPETVDAAIREYAATLEAARKL